MKSEKKYYALYKSLKDKILSGEYKALARIDVADILRGIAIGGLLAANDQIKVTHTANSLRNGISGCQYVSARKLSVAEQRAAVCAHIYLSHIHSPFWVLILSRRSRSA